MKKIIISLVAVVVVAGVLFLAIYNFIGNRSDSLRTSTNSIAGSLENIGELATAEYVYTLTQTAEKPNKEIAGLKIPLTSSKIIFSYSGEVKAGFDFADVSVDVDEITQTIKGRLPEAKLLSNEIDTDSLVVYDESNSPFNTFSISDINESQANLKEQAELSAKDSGLYEKAIDNGKTIISAMLWSLYDKNEYTVEFK